LFGKRKRSIYARNAGWRKTAIEAGVAVIKIQNGCPGFATPGLFPCAMSIAKIQRTLSGTCNLNGSIT